MKRILKIALWSLLGIGVLATFFYLYQKSQPKIIINDKPSTQERLEGLSPDSIVSIKVIKDAKGKEKYNAPNGVIMIITKEEKNK